MKLSSVLAFVAAAILIATIIVVDVQRKENILLDRDDSAFFETSRKLSSLGDHEFALATAALNKNKLKLALRFSHHAEKAYKNAMEYGKYKKAKELSRTLETTIVARDRATKLQMAISVSKAKKIENRVLASEAEQARLAQEAHMQLVVSKADQVRCLV